MYSIMSVHFDIVLYNKNLRPAGTRPRHPYPSNASDASGASRRRNVIMPVLGLTAIPYSKQVAGHSLRLRSKAMNRDFAGSLGNTE